MLQEFIAHNRDEIISRCRAKVATRSFARVPARNVCLSRLKTNSTVRAAEREQNRLGAWSCFQSVGY